MKNSKVRMIAEGAISIALALVLSYLKIPLGVSFGGFGGSIDLVMIPLIVFAVRWGLGWGFIAGLAFGTLKYFVANGTAISWVSIIFDYSVAYACVGFAGLFRRRYNALPVAALVGCIARFIIHFISGVTVYAQYMPDSFMGVEKLTPVVYSVLYNGTYMLPNTILAVVICALLIPAVKKLDKNRR
ncbi:MAG: energy-coupled thiamine transporter ThiT [Oscillospiraceae bacterium]|nr:energy-coupled thiamine transporter ThiT [Oscillospiraceae bacterium]